jgi:hypothetical protein
MAGRNLPSTVQADLQQAAEQSSPLELPEGTEQVVAQETGNKPQAPVATVAEGGYRLGDEVVKSGLSGAVGTTIRPLDLVSEPLREILVERQDYSGAHIPDRVRIKGRTKSKYSTGYLSSDCTDMEICSDSYNVVTLNDVDIAPAGITAIGVCLTVLDNKVAGLELRGHVLTASGDFAEYYSNTDTRGQCANWDTLAACGLDYIATGVEVHFRETGVAANLPYKVTGLQLLCRRVIKG